MEPTRFQGRAHAPFAQGFLQAPFEPGAERFEARVALRPELAERREARGDRDRVSGKSSSLVDAAERRQLVHDVGATAERRERHAPAEHLSEAGQIGGDPGKLLHAASRDAEAGNHLVEDEQRAEAARKLAQCLEETGFRQHDAHVADDRLDDDRGDLPPA